LRNNSETESDEHIDNFKIKIKEKDLKKEKSVYKGIGEESLNNSKPLLRRVCITIILEYK
jgi:hypothetical protein